MRTFWCKNQENPSDRISHAWAPLRRPRNKLIGIFDKKNCKFFSAVNFIKFLVIKSLVLDRIRIGIQLRCWIWIRNSGFRTDTMLRYTIHTLYIMLGCLSAPTED